MKTFHAHAQEESTTLAAVDDDGGLWVAVVTTFSELAAPQWVPVRPPASASAAPTTQGSGVGMAPALLAWLYNNGAPATCTRCGDSESVSAGPTTLGKWKAQCDECEYSVEVTGTAKDAWLAFINSTGLDQPQQAPQQTEAPPTLESTLAHEPPSAEDKKPKGRARPEGFDGKHCVNPTCEKPSPTVRDRQGYYYILCLDCRASGPEEPSPAEAWEKWHQGFTGIITRSDARASAGSSDKAYTPPRAARQIERMQPNATPLGED